MKLKFLLLFLLLPILGISQEIQTIGEPADTLAQNQVKIVNYLRVLGTAEMDLNLTVVGDIRAANLYGALEDSSIEGSKFTSALWTEINDLVIADLPDSAALYDSLSDAWQDNISDSLVDARTEWRSDIGDSLSDSRIEWRSDIGDTLANARTEWRSNIGDTLANARTEWRSDIADSLENYNLSDSLYLRKLYGVLRSDSSSVLQFRNKYSNSYRGAITEYFYYNPNDHPDDYWDWTSGGFLEGDTLFHYPSWDWYVYGNGEAKFVVNSVDVDGCVTNLSLIDGGDGYIALTRADTTDVGLTLMNDEEDFLFIFPLAVGNSGDTDSFVGGVINDMFYLGEEPTELDFGEHRILNIDVEDTTNTAWDHYPIKFKSTISPQQEEAPYSYYGLLQASIELSSDAVPDSIGRPSEYMGGINGIKYDITVPYEKYVYEVDGFSINLTTYGNTGDQKASWIHAVNYGNVSSFVYGTQFDVYNYALGSSAVGQIGTAVTQRNRIQNSTGSGALSAANIDNAFVFSGDLDNSSSVVGKTSTIGTGIGYNYALANGSKASITDHYGVRINISNASGSTIGTNYGLYVGKPTNSGTITNSYGLYLGDQTISGATDNYSIYSDGGKMYHKGEIETDSFVKADSIAVNNLKINETIDIPDLSVTSSDFAIATWVDIASATSTAAKSVVGDSLPVLRGTLRDSANAAIAAITWSGDLSGTGTSPSLADNTVHEAEINWGGVDSDSLTEAIRDANIYQSQTFTFLQPDSIREVVTDSLVFYCFDDLSYPNGAKLGKVRITTSAAVTDTIAIYEYSTRAGAAIAVIDSFMLSSSQDAESLAVDLDDSDMAADSWLCLDLSMWDATCKTLEVTIVYYIKPGN